MSAPDKCPVCNGPIRTDHSQTSGFAVMLCGSHYGVDGRRQHQSGQCIQSERDQLLARVKRLEEAGARMYPHFSKRETPHKKALADQWEEAIR